MSFFLLGKTAGDRLYVVSENLFATRSDALHELSAITADASFDAWDDEILVIDDATGTPVLLVRPSAPEPVQDAVADIPAEPLAGVLDGDEDTSADTPGSLDEASDGELSEDAVAEVAEESPGGELAVPLKDALLRTAVQLEAEGIQAPESVGPEEAAVDSAAFDSLDGEDAFVTEAPDETEPAEVADETPESVEDESPQDEETAVAEPDAEEAVVAEPAEEPLPVRDPVSEQAAPAAWPWDSEGGIEALGLNVLDEPGEDEGSLVRAAGDDETMAAARPVIMGAYEDDEGGSPVLSPEPDAATETTEAVPPMSDVAEVGQAPAGSEPEPEPETVVPVIGPESDYVDLRALSELEIPAASCPPIDSMTCGDCVYVETCPNKGQRLPASCGSFQWK